MQCDVYFATMNVKYAVWSHNWVLKFALKEVVTNENQLLCSCKKGAGWARILSLVAGFSTPDDLPKTVVFDVAIQNNTPEDIPLSGCTIEFIEGDGQHRNEELRYLE